MKYALVNGELLEAEPGLSATCKNCGSQMIAKCGDFKVKHWSHHKIRNCDPWWENETEWHRLWKGCFPKEWQEVIQYAEDGEKHIADVKTDQGFVIEFQHSPIKSEERQARENFYKKMVWIIDGKRRLRDKDKFMDGWDFSTRIDGRDDLRSLKNGGALAKDWEGRSIPVLFDFGDDNLWGLLPKAAEGEDYTFKVSRNTVIESLNSSSQSNSSFERLLRNYTGTIAAYEWRLKVMRDKSQRDLFLFNKTNYSTRRRP